MAAVINFGEDPTIIGWTTFALYVLAGMLSFRSAAILRSRGFTEVGRSWRVLAILLVMLAVNKELDLQTWVIALARRVALKDHFYERRFLLHAVFFTGVVLLLGLFLFWQAAQARLFIRQFPIAATGCVLIGAYIVTRAASIEHIDRWLGLDWDEVPFLWLLEVVGLALVIGQAIRILMNPTR